MTTGEFGYDKTVELIANAVRRFPDRVNPRYEEATIPGQGAAYCQYTSQDGQEHCIAGQCLVDVGLEAPPYGESVGFISLVMDSEDTAIRDKFTEEAIGLLAAAQEVFDGVGSESPTWSEAWDDLSAEIRRTAEEGYRYGADYLRG